MDGPEWKGGTDINGNANDPVFTWQFIAININVVTLSRVRY